MKRYGYLFWGIFGWADRGPWRVPLICLWGWLLPSLGLLLTKWACSTVFCASDSWCAGPGSSMRAVMRRAGWGSPPRFWRGWSSGFCSG